MAAHTHGQRCRGRSLTPVRIASLGLIACTCITALAACQTSNVTTSDSRPMPPRPRAIKPPPDSAVPNRMTLLVGQKPIDTNGNGYPDQVEVSSTLFAWPHTTGMEAAGVFEFTLYPMGHADRPDGQPLATWTIPIEPGSSHLARTIWGYSYNFQLSITAARGSDELPGMRGDLRGRFIPAGDQATPVACSNEVRMVQLGRSAHAGATLGQN